MHDRIRGSRAACALLIAALASLAPSACGSSSSSSGNATTLLKQTFGGAHSVTSGKLSFTLTVNPSGSRTLTGPISLSFGGPFQSPGAGKLPKSDFNVSISAQGKTGSLGILSTGTTGYVTSNGASYQLPAATFQRLEASFAQVASSPGGGSGSSTLSKLGIHPLSWLVNPAVVGTESISGADTTHIRAAVNVAALLADLETFLQKASSLGVTGAAKIPTSISQSTREKIAGEVQNPTFDVWTGTSDKTVRKLAINLTTPVTGQLSTALGGLRSAAIGLTMQYADLNQPQTISAPTNVRPYSEFATKLRTFLAPAQSSVGGATGTASSSASATTTTTSASAKAQRYGQCIIAAHNDIAKMQRCAALVNGP
jgi:hypothetical protein